uniref:Uncharacterized protein n=1 Tax=viral metagenome TaxID=1070528 RepID=A0A6H1ZKE5_9ZZZZ
MAFEGLGNMSAPGAAGVGAGGSAGFDWGSLMSNPMVLQMMASMGASLDPEGPAGTIGGVTNQWIQNQSYLKMMKKLLGGGAKLTIDGKTGKFGLTGDNNLFSGSALSGGSDSIDRPAFSAGGPSQGGTSF